MLDVWAHVGRNCLYLTLAGQVDEVRAPQVASWAAQEMERLRPGFALVCDVACAEAVSETELEQVRSVKRAAQARGVARVAHVVGRSARVALQLERISRQVGCRANLAFSREEAEHFLERPAQMAL